MLKRYVEEATGVPALDVITYINPLNNVDAERLGYPTQKPLALLKLLIESSTDEGDVVFDPCCGCGTTIAAADRKQRKWIGIDITYQSIALVLRRLEDIDGFYNSQRRHSHNQYLSPIDFERQFVQQGIAA
jgi:DNA modification methylase